MRAIYLLSVTVIYFSTLSCNYQLKKPEFISIQPDTLNTFNVGEKFEISTGENSCCMYCWLDGNSVLPEWKLSKLLKKVSHKYEKAERGCDGCSSYSTHVLECVAPGTDSMVYLVIPMGEVDVYDCDSFAFEKVRAEHKRVYRFSVKN
jgi:hypothetical protein